MGKKKGKDKDKSKKQAERSAEKQAEQSGEQPAEPEGSEQSLINAMMAARESAMALQEAASAFSRQMNATNELLATQQTAQGYADRAESDADLDTASRSGFAGISGSSMGAGIGAQGMSSGIGGAANGMGALDSGYGGSQYGGAAYAQGSAPYPANYQSFGRATSYRSLSASRRANKAQAGLAPSMPDPAYPMGASGYGYAQNAQLPGYGSPYQPQAMPDQHDMPYQQGARAQGSPYASAYQGYSTPYGYGNAPAPAETQSQSRTAAQQVAAAQSAAFNAASKANAVSGQTASQVAPEAAASGSYSSYAQNPAYAVNEDLLVGLPKFGEAPYPLPEPHEILESVPSLSSLAYGATAAQMHPDAYSSQASASTADYSASDAGSYSPQSGESDEDGVIFAYVEEAEPINLVDSPDSKRSKKKKKRDSAEEADYSQAQQYASAPASYANSDMEEISIPAVYGSEEGFSVELPMEADGDAYHRSAPEEISAVYYEVDDSSDASDSASGYYDQAQGSAAYAAYAQGQEAFETWNHDADAYESYDGYYYDDAGNVFYYDENGYPYYYGEDGNAYYYDGYDSYAGQSMQAPKGSTGMILGVFSILFAFIPIIGLILGIIASKKAKKYINMGGPSPSAYTARLLGKLGIILSIVLLVVYIGLVVAFFLSLYPPTIMGALRSFLATTPLSFLVL